MFIKLVGAVLLIISGTGLGIFYGMEPELRRRELAGLKGALMIMHSETKFGHTHLAPMCRRAAQNCEGGISRIFISFADSIRRRDTEDIQGLWQSCVESVKDTHLTDGDKEAISALGKGLGAEDIDLQLSAIMALVSYIDSKDEELVQLSSKNLRLYRSGGALIGIFAVILLF